MDWPYYTDLQHGIIYDYRAGRETMFTFAACDAPLVVKVCELLNADVVDVARPQQAKKATEPGAVYCGGPGK